MKQLTIAIPSYNAEPFLEKCLDSMCGIDDRLEVIVVNDGSKDATSQIAHDYANRFPNQVRVIDKENGGHGSGINAGLDAAKGRYYKVVDADDWITTDRLKSILDRIETSDADVLILGYKTVNIQNGVVLEYLPVSNSSGRQIDVIKLNDKFDDVNHCLEFHCMCYNTAFLRGTGIRMSEHTFYEDQEFAILPLAFGETFLIHPEPLYEYRIGDASQSTNFANQAKRADDHLFVTKRIVETYVSLKPMGQARDRLMTRRITRSIISLYATLLVKNPDKREGREKAEEFRTYLSVTDPNLMKQSDKKYRLFRFAGRFGFVGTLYGKLFNSASFAGFKKRWIR